MKLRLASTICLLVFFIAGCSMLKSSPEKKVRKQYSSISIKKLEPGDILLQFVGSSKTSHAIAMGQKQAGQAFYFFTHAALVLNDKEIVEQVGKGLTKSPYSALAKKEYLVLRSTQDNIADGAATFAQIILDIDANHHNMKYSVSKAIQSLGDNRPTKYASQLDDEFDSMLSGEAQASFCSKFIAFDYQFVAAQNNIAPSAVMPGRDDGMTPAKLADSTINNKNYFKVIGILKK